MADELSREEKLRLPPKVFLDISDAPLLNGQKPHDNPRRYNMTDEEALEFNAQKKAEREAKAAESGA